MDKVEDPKFRFTRTMAIKSKLRRLFRRPMESYDGLHCGCAPGTHKAIYAGVLGTARPDSAVLDFGTHSGALLARFKKAGFSDLHGVDLDPTRFELDGAQFYRIDLNQDFATEFARKFGIVTATEVIEHLDSPRHFVSEVYQLLEPNGVFAISLPNVAFWEGRCKFMLKGELWGFGARNYLTQRHISPLTFDQLILMLKELGFTTVVRCTAGSFATPLKKILTAPIWLPMRVLGGASTLGESAIIIAVKSEPDDELRRPSHYKDRWEGKADTIGLSDEV